MSGNIAKYRYDSTGKKHKASWFVKMRETLEKKKLYINCNICNQFFYISPCRMGVAKFCSRKCQSKSFERPLEQRKIVRRESQLASENRRRARKLSAHIVDFTIEQWEELKRKYNYMCLCCKRFEPDIKLTQDHIVPISFGGNHTLSNIQPLCRSCNSRKHAREIDYRSPITPMAHTVSP